MPCENGNPPLALDIPDLNARVRTGNSQVPTVGVPGYHLLSTGTGSQVGHERTLSGIINRDLRGVRIANGEFSAIGMESQCVRCLRQGPALNLFAVGQIITNHTPALPHRQLPAKWTEGLTTALQGHPKNGPAIGTPPDVQPPVLIPLADKTAIGTEIKSATIGARLRALLGAQALKFAILGNAADVDDAAFLQARITLVTSV